MVSVPFAYPYPSLFYNVAAQAFLALKAWSLPPNVVLLNLGVGDSVIAQMEIGALLTLILGMPWIVHEVGAFLVPALRQHETRLLRQIGIPASRPLRRAGTLARPAPPDPPHVPAPLPLRRGDGHRAALGIDSFVEFALLYSLAFGLAFELPVFVYALTRLGVSGGVGWRKHWRGAVIGSLVFGMIVTPDNSGITMLLVATPMMALYFGGVWFAGAGNTELRPTRPIGEWGVEASAMALFSDIDWAILLVAAAFLLFGKENRRLLRTLGRILRTRDAPQAGAPVRVRPGRRVCPRRRAGHAFSLRDALVSASRGLLRTASHIPAAVTRVARDDRPRRRPSSWAGGIGPDTWSVALPRWGRRRGPPMSALTSTRSSP